MSFEKKGVRQPKSTMMKSNRFGLIGKNISYSFSKGYFTQKFSEMGLKDHTYENFDLQNISDFENVINNNPNIKGLNVTIPYKQEIIPYLDILEEQAREIGAVNTIQFTENGLKGHNTDNYGFRNAIFPFIKKHHTKALILGTGGASKAVAFVLDSLGISHTFVSRNPTVGQLSYDELDSDIMKDFTILVNCTPLGTYPNIEQHPNITYQCITQNHLLFDLIYNPEKTKFLKEGEVRGAQISNGLRMLELQADRAWEIWNI